MLWHLLCRLSIYCHTVRIYKYSVYERIYDLVTDAHSQSIESISDSILKGTKIIMENIYLTEEEEEKLIEWYLKEEEPTPPLVQEVVEEVREEEEVNDPTPAIFFCLEKMCV